MSGLSLDERLDMDLSAFAKSGGGGRRGGRGAKRGAGRVFAPGARDSSSPLKRSGAADGSRNRVYVNNLDWAVTWQELKDHFKSAGDVLRADVLAYTDGRSKGCGLVEFATAREATTAIRTLNDTQIRERPIWVREDRVDGPTTSSGDAGRRGTGRGSNRVVVFNLPFRVTWAELKDAFRHFGDVAYAQVEQYPDGKSKGWGVVEFTRAADARRAMESDVSLDGRKVNVREDKLAGGSKPSGGAAASSAPGSRVFVSNLPWDLDWRELKDYFKQCGAVRSANIHEYSNGRSKGHGTVEFVSEEAAGYAVEKLNETELKGRPIRVHMDRDAEGEAAAEAAPSEGFKLYVGNLPFDTAWQFLKDEFSSVGVVLRADIAAQPDGRSKGYGFVTYATEEDAQAAIDKYSGASIDGRSIVVRFATD